ncbi:MAG TPA: hypothetical protein VGJ69_13400 [Pyrinomonadaceae bacterium]
MISRACHRRRAAKSTERAFPLPAAQVKIVRAECGDDAGLLGAARMAFCSEAKIN